MNKLIYIFLALFSLQICIAEENAISFELDHNLSFYKFDVTKQTYVYNLTLGARLQYDFNYRNEYIALKGRHSELNNTRVITALRFSYGIAILKRNVLAGLIVGVEKGGRSVVPFGGAELNIRFYIVKSPNKGLFLSINNSLTTLGSEHTIGLGIDFEL